MMTETSKPTGMRFVYALQPLSVLVLLCGFTTLHCSTECSGEKRGISLNSVKISQSIWEAANDGMGLKKIQEAFDLHGKFSSQVPDWPSLTEKLANLTGERFGNFTVALTRLRLAIEAHYNKSDDKIDIPTCCNLTDAMPKYQKAFKARVDPRQLCTRISRDAKPDLDLPGEGFLKEARKNSQGSSFIKWQYYGTEEGALRVYPAFPVECEFSPRLRPWYVETFAPDPKDIIIVVDGTSHKDSDLVKRSALTIIETTNPNDRIGVVRFGETASTPVGSEKTSTCYKTSLALATPKNKEYLMSYVNETGKSEEAAKYIPAVERAFSLFADTAGSSHGRRQVMLFFTHSKPGDALPENTIDIVKDQMAKMKRQYATPLTILTFAAGSDIQQETEDLLKILSNTSFHGSYTRLTNTSNLRDNLRSYYNSLSHPFEHSLFVLPYIDAWGLGLIISICQPFFRHTIFQGVVCIDGTLGDLLSDIINIRQGVEAYSFIVDNQGRTIHHPYLAQPDDDHKSNFNVHISMLERSEGPEAKEVIAAILQGTPGGRHIRVPLPTAKATFPGQWIERRHVIKHYEWTKIPNTNYTLCIVSTGNDIQLKLAVSKQTSMNYLNAHNIKDNNACLHEGLLSTTERSSVSLDAKAFYKECEEDNMVELLTVYFKSEKERKIHNCIKDYVYDEVQLTGLADSVWKSHQSRKYDSIILWRNLITLGGVRRIYPAVHYHLHTPLVLPWYVKALADVNTIILTRSNVSERIISITMSHVVYEGRTTGIHTHHNLPVAVLAAEFRYSYIMDLVLGLMPCCLDENHSCFLLDESGLVLLHTDVGEEQHDKLGHVLDMEPSLARQLILSGFLKSGKCTNVEQLQIQTFWRITIPGVSVTVSVTDAYFEIQAISGTNTFIVQKEKGSVKDENTCPPCLNFGDIRQCSSCDNTKCNCPCYCDLLFDYCNYTFAAREPFTCPLPVVPMSVKKDDSFLLHQLEYPKCFKNKECSGAESESDCFLLSGCTWCLGDEVNGYTCSLERHCKAEGGGFNKVAVVVILLLLVIVIGATIGIVYYLHSKGYRCLLDTRSRQCLACVLKRDEDVYSSVDPPTHNRDHGTRPPAVPPLDRRTWAPEGHDNMAYAREVRCHSVPEIKYYSNILSMRKKGVATRRPNTTAGVSRSPPPIPTSHSSNQPAIQPTTEGKNVNNLPTKQFLQVASLSLSDCVEPPNLEQMRRLSNVSSYLTTPAEIEMMEEDKEGISTFKPQDDNLSTNSIFLESGHGPELNPHESNGDFSNDHPANQFQGFRRQDALDEGASPIDKFDSESIDFHGSVKALERQEPDGKGNDGGNDYIHVSQLGQS